ncbi:MAG: hypothetical protein ACU837_01975 [Gammaproteobacteria bacterium]
MRTLSVLLLGCICLLNSGCNPERTINARNENTAARSVKIMKEYLPSEVRVEFELAYWTTRDAVRDNKEFLSAIDGKNVPEMIAVGKKYFEQQRAAGIKGYDKYASWDEMVATLIKERKAQSLAKAPENKRDKANNLFYRLSP